MKPENAGFWALGTLAIVLLYFGVRAFDEGGNFKPGYGVPGARPPVVVEDGGRRELLIKPGPGGHFYTQVEMGGQNVPVLIDTGASTLTLTESAALAAGLQIGPSDYKHPSSTANGTILTAHAVLPELRMGPISIYDVDVAVIPDHRLDISLLGMNVLREFGTVEFTPRALRLSVD